MLVRKFSKLSNRVSVSIQFNNKSAINQCEMHSGAVLKQTEVTYRLDVRQSRIASLS